MELPYCLESVHDVLSEQDIKPFHSHEIIVVDNNSQDRTAEIARDYGAVVVFESLNQIARARNAGARIADGEWLLFIDADSRLAPNTVANMIKIIASGRYAGGGSTIAMPDAPFWGRLSIVIWNLVSLLLRWAAGSFVFVRKTVFDEVQGFDEDYYAAEEVAFSRAVRARGRQLGLKFAILYGTPHCSSARKFRLYSSAEFTRMMTSGLFRFSATVRSRKDLDYFYDGRREQRSNSDSVSKRR